MDLDKSYDSIDRHGIWQAAWHMAGGMAYGRRHGIWQMLCVYGIGGKLLNAVQSFYVDSGARVLVGMDVSE